MALKSDDIELLYTLLSGEAGPVRAPAAPGKPRMGRSTADMEAFILDFLSDPDKMATLEPGSVGKVKELEAALKKAKATSAGRGDTIRRMLKEGGKKGLLGSVGKMGLGRMALLGTGYLGVGLTALEVLNLLRGGAAEQNVGPKAAMARSTGQMQEMLGMGSGGMTEALRESSMLRQMANLQDRDTPVEPSQELRRLMGSSDPAMLYRMRQQVNPSFREAYARAGLVA